ncbi:MAG: hypothetical protein R2748_33540 [Bryobacterales bacterium]
MNPSDYSSAITAAVGAQIERVVAYMPIVGVALLLVLLGYIAARVARAVAFRASAAIVDRLSKQAIIERGLGGGSLRSRIPVLVRETAFWAVFLLFLAAAVEELQIPAISSPLSALAFYAPRLLSGLLIAIVAFGIGNIVNHWVSSTLAPVGVAQAQMLGRLAQFAVIAVGFVMAADQAGIESTILILALGIVLTVTLGGIALAFAIGCAPMVGNLVASHYAAKQLATGQTARVSNHSGVITQITSAFVVLQTDQGEVLIPARKFLEEASVIAGSAPDGRSA